MNVFVSRFPGETDKILFHIVPEESKVELLADLDKTGTTEEVLEFLKIDGHIARAVEALALGEECVVDWEKFLKKFVELGIEIERTRRESPEKKNWRGCD